MQTIFIERAFIFFANFLQLKQGFTKNNDDIMLGKTDCRKESGPSVRGKGRTSCLQELPVV